MSPKGWHARGYLPHFDSPETVQFVTFGLFDSLPAQLAVPFLPGAKSLLDMDSQLDGGRGAILGRKGPFWRKDYFDRYMRNEEHYARTVEYVENNPVRAGLCATPPAWPWGSAAMRT